MEKKKVNIHKIFSIIVFLIYFAFYIYFRNSHNDNIFENLQFVSILGLILISYIVISWHNSYKRILAPSFVFIIALYLCLCGQSIMWAFDVKAGYRDLQVWGNLFTTFDLCNGLLFSYCCLAMFHMSTIASIKNKSFLNENYDIDNNNFNVQETSYYKIIATFGLILSILFLPLYLINFINMRSIIATYGYGAQFEYAAYGLNSLISKLAEFFPVGIITIFYAFGKKSIYNKKFYKISSIFSFLMALIYLLCELQIGQRTGIILFAIAFLFVFFRDRKVTRKELVLGFIFLILLMSMMRMIDLIRTDKYSGINMFFSYFLSIDNNPIVDFLGDIGWNLMTLMEFQKMIPTVQKFSYGFSYLITFTSLIPNLNFWPIHPAAQYGNISSWLAKKLGVSFGLGCTPAAEAYYNFGLYGMFIFYFWAKLLNYFNKLFEKNTIISDYGVVLFIGILLKSCVRGSVYAVIRPIVLYVFLPVMIVKIIYRKFKIK